MSDSTALTALVQALCASSIEAKQKECLCSVCMASNEHTQSKGFQCLLSQPLLLINKSSRDAQKSYLGVCSPEAPLLHESCDHFIDFTVYNDRIEILKMKKKTC